MPRWAAGPLTVLALLAGLLAMHGLGPSPAMAAPAHGAATSGAPSGATAGTMPGATPSADAEAEAGVEAGVTSDRYCHDPGGHPEHADPTCAAAAVGGTPAPQAAPSAAPVVTDAVATGVPAPRPGHDLGGRAPPSLSELQLLRI
ncbi:hypothetical protein E1283_11200 [Streptomyces hainanensis]|uniref:Uncharacterized protein n=1 Tax=Streptomyces hainanensis TaxID=402648 RepID=A0A4R4TER2_9ACTN|nr:hypothetical protein E1283_11200 [Streptomyces hainanensis]